jgi:hypothetical protein
VTGAGLGARAGAGGSDWIVIGRFTSGTADSLSPPFQTNAGDLAMNQVNGGERRIAHPGR